MKFTHLKAVVGAMALSVALAGSAQAQVVLADITSEVSNSGADVEIGVSTVNGGPHRADRVGISVPNLASTSPRQFVDFQGLQTVAAPVVHYTGKPGVSTVNNPTGTITDHSQYGRFDFTKVDGQNLYYGEWNQSNDASLGDHTVYFAGTGATLAANVPTSGTATYSVQGLSDYANNSQLNGTFTANFSGSGGTLTGSIASATYALNIGTANISGNGFSGSGAVASNPSTSATLATNGNVSGNFFGSAAQALAGVATFANNQYDAAFGGSQ